MRPDVGMATTKRIREQKYWLAKRLEAHPKEDKASGKIQQPQPPSLFLAHAPMSCSRNMHVTIGGVTSQANKILTSITEFSSASQAESHQLPRTMKQAHLLILLTWQIIDPA
jgi:hypothetical protein